MRTWQTLAALGPHAERGPARALAGRLGAGLGILLTGLLSHALGAPR
jgi:hypothetical protein